MRTVAICAAALLAGACLGQGQMAVEQWVQADVPSVHKAKLTVRNLAEGDEDGPWHIQVDLSDLPADTQVLHASLHAARELLDGNTERG